MLATELEKTFKGNTDLVTYKPEGDAKEFSECWPDSLSNASAFEHFKWKAT